MALYVCLVVYAGLSLFIIRWANVYLVVCILTRITLHYEDTMMKWESKSSIPVNLNISQGQSTPFTHCSYSYPAMSLQRDQPEHRCIDPGHTLANMRSQISRHGYTFCKTAAFKRVSESNHSVLPKSILEDKLDRQSIRIAKRFFSKEVRDELVKNNDHNEAKFVGLVHNWYEACDE